MTGVSNLLPEWLVRGTGSERGSAGIAAEAGPPPKGLAEAWRREMERQQQLAWFLPTLPMPAVLPWATDQALATTADFPRGPAGSPAAAMAVAAGSSDLGYGSPAGPLYALHQEDAASGRGSAGPGATVFGEGSVKAIGCFWRTAQPKRRSAFRKWLPCLRGCLPGRKHERLR